MSDDLIDHYTKSGLISDPTRNFRPCDGCGRRFHPDDLMTRDVENYGEHETIELCERCDTPPEPSARDNQPQHHQKMPDTPQPKEAAESGSDSLTCSVSSRPTLLDAKWLDPECWEGCQSLRWKNALRRIVTDFERLNGMECDRHCGQCIKCIAADALSDSQNSR